MAFYTDGVVPWNSLDNNTRGPLSSEFEGGYPCGEADQELFNWTAGWPIGNIWNMILQSGITPDPDKLLDLARAVQAGKVNYAVAAGTANALTATLSPVPASLTAGMTVNLLVSTVNTGATTLNLNGLGEKPIVTATGAPLLGGDIPAGSVVSLVYSGTAWILSLTSAFRGNSTTYATGGTYTWVCPAGVFRVKAHVTGAGGGGARATSGHSASSGGAGGTAIGYAAVIPGTSYTIIVGTGGNPGNYGSGGTESGLPGSSSSALGLTGNGGGGGNLLTNGSGGLASGGGIANIRGGDGQDSIIGSSTLSTNGGASFWGGGLSAGTADGAKGITPGTGGSGAYGGTAIAGGAGADGIVVLEY
ncbi:hypothetical protein N5K21_26480 [Rhizobium pusense]|uniref:glycine-rich domain-containing protein n=1 Tax=Agrobacterium pusense TaxID=648995 RepID=UPI0024493814|nr:hypothetical protein [Agrobacterium pusense]MDH2092269.1 hypothetical protein [Agrobacterium pusense]